MLAFTTLKVGDPDPIQFGAKNMQSFYSENDLQLVKLEIIISNTKRFETPPFFHARRKYGCGVALHHCSK